MRTGSQIIGFLGMVVLMLGVGNTFRAWHPDAEPDTRRARYIVAVSAIFGSILLGASLALFNGQT